MMEWRDENGELCRECTWTETIMFLAALSVSSCFVIAAFVCLVRFLLERF